ncbi:hypothetical protein ACGFZP_11515 [Kitasatospora sp. NPDC048239]|uniref:hypothetical protein n=1 Tax=Kitasatospora sp. NPDC048239 TaxID=3364046 RepID=UPI00371D2339
MHTQQERGAHQLTQDGQFSTEAVDAGPFTAAERVSATLGTLTDALFDERTSRHPAASLTALRAASHPSAESLLGLPLAPNGPVHAAVPRLGTVVTAGTARPGSGARVSGLAATALLARYGGEPVRGTTPGQGAPTAALFELPVTGEIADPKLRPPFTAALAALASGQQTRQPIELATGSGAEVRLVVPPGFHALTSPGGPAGVSARTVPTGPITGDGTDPATGAAAAELTAHLAEVAEELFSGTGPAPRRDLAVIAASLADVITDSGVVYAGVSALEVDGRAADATLVVSLARHPLPVTGLATELATLRRHAEVWTVLLPAGPANVLVEGRSVPVPGPLAADGLRRWVVTSVVEAFVPLPDGVSVLCVQLSTAQPQDWELYTEVFAELLKSVQFGWDGVAGRLPEPVSVPVAVPTAVPAPVAVPVPATAPVPVAVATPPHGVPAEAEAPAVVPVPAPPVAAPPVDSVPPVAPAVPVLASAPAAPVAAEPEQPVRKGTPVRIPPADFNPFAPIADTPSAAPAGPEEDEDRRPKGTPVTVPPPDFNPFAPQPPTLTDTTVPQEDEERRPKGTPVTVPPPDFNPFAPQALPTAAEPEPAPTATAVQAADPFGTVMAGQSVDPFGTTIPQQPGAVPPPPSAPPAVPAPTVPVPRAAAEAEPDDSDDPDRKPKGTPVTVPPPDFNPFAPQALPTAAEPEPAPTAAPETSPFG